MIARAPGKLVLSGAYAVLSGAPALVAAVDRYATADAGRAADQPTPEVMAAIRKRPDVTRAPWFDASPLRTGGPLDRKLGLGSSAAILVASLASMELSRSPDLADERLAELVLLPALAAHREAQGGGSGIDVAASAHGGVLCCRVMDGDLSTQRVSLPARLVIEAWAGTTSASTPDLLLQVRRFAERDSARHALVFDRLSTAANAAAGATDAASFVEAIGNQATALAELGTLSDAPIVTPDVADLDRAARAHHGVVLPSGAGGGDVVLWMGTRPVPDVVARQAERYGFSPLALHIGARGVHAADERGHR